MQLNRTLSAAWIASAAIITVACGGGTPSSPSTRLSSVDAAEALSGRVSSTRAVGDATNNVPEFGLIKVCKAGDVSGTFTVTGGNAAVQTTANPTIAAGSCIVVAETVAPVGDNSGASITITEAPATNLQSVSIMRIDSTPGGPQISGPIAGTNPDTFFVNRVHGFVVTFTNDAPDPPPPPPPGDEGCTPGYWKADQHLDSWAGTGLAPGADFDTTFGVNFFNPNITLLQALNLGGGGVNALARHAVAALLNASSADVDYQYTTAQVLDIVQGDGAYAGMSVEDRKNLLAAANEAGCPLN